MISVINEVYVVIDMFLIVMGLIVVFYWGRTGLLAKTLWLLVLGIICYSAGDILWLVSDATGGAGLVSSIGDGIWQIQMADVSYLFAVLLWLAAFTIPVVHILRQPKMEELIKKDTQEIEKEKETK